MSEVFISAVIGLLAAIDRHECYSTDYGLEKARDRVKRVLDDFEVQDVDLERRETAAWT